MSHRYEDAVLNGTALLLLDLPPALRNVVQPLQKLFDTHYPDNGITRILLNTPPIRSTSGENVMECGAVFFSSSKALWTILDRVRVLLRTEDGALELRRGYLTLGVHEVLVEGVVTWGADGRQRPNSVPRAATPTLAPDVALCAEDGKSSSMSESAPTAAPKPVSVPPITSATASEAVRAPRNEEMRSSRRETLGGAERCGEVCQTVVVTFLFKEIYNRHRENNEDRTHGRQGGVPASFPLSPFMVYQMLVGECQPRKIVVIECQRAAAKREWRALVELENAEVAAQVIRVFTRRAVEFVSESNAYKPPERSRKPPEKGPLPICAEVRYYVNCSYSVRKGQSRFLPNGTRNYHRTVAVRPFCKAELDLTDLQNLARLQVRAPREWKHDSHAIRPASIRESESPDRAEMCEEEGRPKEAPSAEVPHKRRRSPSPRNSRRRSRRSPSYSRSRSASRSSSRSYSPDSSSSSSRRYRWRHGRRVDRRHGDGRWHDARAAAPREHQNTEAVVPVAAVAPETALPVEAQSMAAATHAQTQPQQKSHVTCESASATPALPAVTYDSHGPLPVWWRPIFSQEYQQTYYAYRDPNTGVETTTWERPAT
ncbi:conserved hypothetical protein [Leishmania mexicana MHOM/GT/2001/U1103]|uniref:Uncharacterized protein n=1 Tax=Leishmania mexicana (strain MHOM/GT/2001/U1103) TaxID=929439 RepID=E9B3T0_LEIMU|nr:conserved hypothetical protein [Leishmania mexicana MHOM/GT/2001/U1103]CBZ29897.1 conserved hypothetical protein [Leishmania mexicana MHOM/GT/2001/U1103]